MGNQVKVNFLAQTENRQIVFNYQGNTRNQLVSQAENLTSLLTEVASDMLEGEEFVCFTHTDTDFEPRITKFIKVDDEGEEIEKEKYFYSPEHNPKDCSKWNGNYPSWWEHPTYDETLNSIEGGGWVKIEAYWGMEVLPNPIYLKGFFNNEVEEFAKVLYEKIKENNNTTTVVIQYGKEFCISDWDICHVEQLPLKIQKIVMEEIQY